MEKEMLWQNLPTQWVPVFAGESNRSLGSGHGRETKKHILGGKKGKKQFLRERECNFVTVSDDSPSLRYNWTTFLVTQPANAGNTCRVQSLGWEDHLQNRMATHSSILTWRIPWREEPGGLQSMGLQRAKHDLTAKQQQLLPQLLWLAALLHDSGLNWVPLREFHPLLRPRMRMASSCF